MGMLAHPVIPLPEVFAIPPTLLCVHAVKYNKVSHPEDVVLAVSTSKIIRHLDGFHSEAQSRH